MSYSPIMIDCLDDESKSGRDTVDILAHDLLDNGRLASAVKAPAKVNKPSVEVQAASLLTA